jgi:pilus assembly protein TadC
MNIPVLATHVPRIRLQRDDLVLGTMGVKMVYGVGIMFATALLATANCVISADTLKLASRI